MGDAEAADTPRPAEAKNGEKGEEEAQDKDTLRKQSAEAERKKIRQEAQEARKALEAAAEEGDGKGTSKSSASRPKKGAKSSDWQVDDWDDDEQDWDWDDFISIRDFTVRVELTNQQVVN